MDNKNYHRLQVTKEERGIPLVSFIRNHIPHLSGKEIKKAIDEERGCVVNGKIVFFSSYKVQQGDQISFKKGETKIKHPSNISILYEDDDVIIINKPPHIASHESTLKKSLRKSFFLVHRLDKETSGILILAKHLKSKHHFEGLFRKRAICKSYLALVEGHVQQEEGIVENYLGPLQRFEGGCIWGEVPKSKGVLATTKWRLLEKLEDSSLLLCHPITGRTHQIRIHLKGIGHPILGDTVYGSPYRKYSHHLLHAYAVEWIDPIDAKLMHFEAPLPQEMSNRIGDRKVCLLSSS